MSATMTVIGGNQAQQAETASMSHALAVTQRRLDIVSAGNNLVEFIESQTAAGTKDKIMAVAGITLGGTGVLFGLLAPILMLHGMIPPLALITIPAGWLTLKKVGYPAADKVFERKKVIDDCWAQRRARLRQATIDKICEIRQHEELKRGMMAPLAIGEKKPIYFFIDDISSPEGPEDDGPVATIRYGTRDKKEKYHYPLLSWMNGATFTNDELKGALTKRLALPEPPKAAPASTPAPIDRKAQIEAALMPDILLAYQQNQLSMDATLRCKLADGTPLIATITAFSVTQGMTDTVVNLSLKMSLHRPAHPENPHDDTKGASFAELRTIDCQFDIPKRFGSVKRPNADLLHQGYAL